MFTHNQNDMVNTRILSNKKRKEGNDWFNEALNTFYLQLYDIRHMAKEHSDSEREKPTVAT